MSFNPFPDFVPESPPSWQRVADIASWVRLSLTGSASGDSPDSDTIDTLASSVIAQVNQRYPTCLASAPDSLGDADLAAYNEAVGCMVAARIVQMPGGAQFAQFVVESKQGTVSQKLMSPAQTAAEAKDLLTTDGNAALSRIACVRERLAQANTNAGTLFSLTGVRRSKGCGCL